jgi:hypothetical protein
MDEFSREPRQFILRREVEAPQRQNAGVGVMLVASAAMFFAVASSAFILRAQMPREHCPRSLGTVPEKSEVEPLAIEAVPVQLVDPVEASTVETCGEPVYQDNPDGTVTVYFDLCAPAKAP